MPTGSIFAAWQPLCMSRRSWVMVTDFKMRVLRLKPGVHILGSSRSIRHTKVEILRLKSYFLHKKETKLSRKINLWKTFFLLEFVIVSRFFWCLSFLLFPSNLNVSLSVYLWATKCLTLKPWNNERQLQNVLSAKTLPQNYSWYSNIEQKIWITLPFTPYVLANRWSHKNKTYLFVSMGGFLLS